MTKPDPAFPDDVCIVCGGPVPIVGPKTSLPPRNGWAHPQCAASSTKEKT